MERVFHDRDLTLDVEYLRTKPLDLGAPRTPYGIVQAPDRGRPAVKTMCYAGRMG